MYTGFDHAWETQRYSWKTGALLAIYRLWWQTSKEKKPILEAVDLAGMFKIKNEKREETSGVRWTFVNCFQTSSVGILDTEQREGTKAPDRPLERHSPGLGACWETAIARRWQRERGGSGNGWKQHCGHSRHAQRHRYTCPSSASGD